MTSILQTNTVDYGSTWNDNNSSSGSSQKSSKTTSAVITTSLVEIEDNGLIENLNSGELSYEEDVAGGMGRHLGVFSCTLLIVGRIIGTGIFSTPSSILMSVGSIGASLVLWIVGFLVSYASLLVLLELGTMFPRSGGEKVYLEAMYKRPRHLATMFYAFQAILLGFTASGCIVFAKNILIVAGLEANLWNTRVIALGVISFVTLIHGLTPEAGIFFMNALSIFKIVILTFIIATGWAILCGKTRISDPAANFRNPFEGSSRSSGDYATAMFKVLNAYAGYANVNYVLNEVKNPVRTLLISGPLGLALCAIFYLFINIAYFSAATKEEILDADVTVASLFFRKVFGTTGQRALTIFVSLSALGNVLTVTFSMSRLNQELAKEGIPLPFGNKFWASNWPTSKAPLPGLIMHLIPSVIVIIAPPPKVVYPFILNVEGYPSQIMHVLVIIGLILLRFRNPNILRPFKAWWPVIIFSLLASLFLIIDPFVPPENGVGDTPPLPYYLYCLVGIGVLLSGILYWAIWTIVLPNVFKYELIPRKEILSDGTVVTVFDRKRHTEPITD